MKYKTMITAHAGSEGTPDNTLESIRYMCTLGTECIEIDMRMYEGELLLTHNPVQPGIEYTKAADAFAEIAKYPELSVNVDLKEHGLIPPVMALAERYGIADRIIFTGNPDDEEQKYILENGYTFWYHGNDVPEGALGDPTAYVKGRGFEKLNASYKGVSDAVVSACPQELSLWTVNTEELLEKYLRAGIFNITTRIPLAALRLRKEICG